MSKHVTNAGYAAALLTELAASNTEDEAKKFLDAMMSPVTLSMPPADPAKEGRTLGWRKRDNEPYQDGGGRWYIRDKKGTVRRIERPSK